MRSDGLCLATCAAFTLLFTAWICASAGEPPAPAANPQRQLLVALTEIAQRQPQHVGALYIAARTAAALGDEAATIQWLDRLAAVGMADELDPDDFGAFARTPAFRERAARFAAAAPPIGTASTTIELQCADLLPEGTAFDRRRNEILVSSGRRRTVVAIDARGQCRDIVPAGDGGLLAVLGMQADPDNDALWVASAAAPFMLDALPGEAGRALLSRIDLAGGRVTASYPLPSAGLLNDLARGQDGSIYITESRGGTVYRLPPGGDALSPLLPPETFDSPNGIVMLAGGQLLVADFNGLALISHPGSSTPRVTRLATPADLYLGGIDGLALANDRVVGIQNLVGRSRIWMLDIDPAKDRVRSASVLLRGHPDFLNPTTGVVAAGRFMFIADTKLQNPQSDGTLSAVPAGRTGHRLLGLSIPGPAP
jgi:sugar lactone lactonase YvrE